MPVSSRNKVWAGSEAVITTVPMRGPLIAGLKVTSIVQFAPGARLPWHWSFSEKSMPDAVMSRMVTGLFPTLASVAVIGWLLSPTGWVPKSILGGVRVTEDGGGAIGATSATCC